MNLSNSLQNQIVNYTFTRNQREYSLYNIRQQLENINKESMALERAISTDHSVSILLPDLYSIRNQIKIVEEKITELKKMMSNEKTISIMHPELYGIKVQIDNVEKDIEDLNEKKNNIKPIEIIEAPTTTKLSKVNKKHLLLASAVGLFLMVFITFFMEYLSKYKRVNK